MQLSTSLLQDMVQHWLSTPVGTYLGSNYGNSAKSMLQRPQSVMAEDADAFIAKLKIDVQVIGQLPADQLGLFMETSAPDVSRIILSIGGTTFEVPL